MPPMKESRDNSAKTAFFLHGLCAAALLIGLAGCGSGVAVVGAAESAPLASATGPTTAATTPTAAPPTTAATPTPTAAATPPPAAAATSCGQTTVAAYMSAGEQAPSDLRCAP
jgi:hypothetical protein